MGITGNYGNHSPVLRRRSAQSVPWNRFIQKYIILILKWLNIMKVIKIIIELEKNKPSWSPDPTLFYRINQIDQVSASLDF